MRYTVNILFDSTGDNVILLKKARTEFTGKYNGCGGEIEDYETPEECAIREINEETGIVFNLGELIEIGTLSLSDGIHDCKHPDKNAPVLVFYAGVIPADQTPTQNEAEPLGVFPVHSVLNQTVDSPLLAGNGDLLYFIHMGYKLCREHGLFRHIEKVPVCTGVSLTCKLDRSNNKLPKLYECRFQTSDKPSRTHTHYVISRRALPMLFVDKTRNEFMPDGVVALLFDQEKRHILLLKQFRYSVGEYVYTLPGGLVDPGETPKQAILREVYEETGWGTTSRPLFSNPDDIKALPPVFTDPSASDQSVQLFILQACHAEAVPPVLKPGAPSPNELITPVWIDQAQARQILQSNLSSDQIKTTQLTQAMLYAWLCGADFRSID